MKTGLSEAEDVRPRPPLDELEAQVRHRTEALQTEIHERARTEEALRESEQRLATLVETAPVGIVIHAGDGRVLRSNAAAQKMLGLSEAEMKGRLLTEGGWQWFREDGSALPPEEMPVARALNSGQPVMDFLVGFRRPNSEEMSWVLTNTVPRFGPDGRVSELTVTSMDMTGRKQVETGQHEELERRVRVRTAELFEMNRTLRAEIARRQQSEEARSHLLRRLTGAQEMERSRISRELHDRLGQELTALKLGLQMVRKQGPIAPAVQRCISQLEELSDSLMRTIHRLAWELRPAALDDLGLDMALRRYAEEWSGQAGVQVDFHSDGVAARRLPAEIETTLYRVTQEALTNVSRHACAERVSILLERRPDHVSLIVEDNGRGFDAEAVLQASSTQDKLGLLGIKERVLLAGGTLDLESTPGTGTTVFVRIPLDPGIGRKIGTHEKTSHRSGG